MLLVVVLPPFATKTLGDLLLSYIIQVSTWFMKILKRLHIPDLYLRCITSVGILCPPFLTRSATRCSASSGVSSQKKIKWTLYPFSCALRTRWIYDLVANVVSIEKVSLRSYKSSIRCNIRRPASIATLSGLKGDNPLAISSALTNSLHCRISGRTVNEAVVLPAPLQPLIIYKFLFIIAKVR